MRSSLPREATQPFLDMGNCQKVCCNIIFQVVATMGKKAKCNCLGKEGYPCEPGSQCLPQTKSGIRLAWI